MSLLEKCAVSDTSLWFQKAVPNPVDKNRSTQLGVHLEEVAEMLKALVATNHTTQILLDNAVDSLEALADTIKTLDNQVEIQDPLEFLDGLAALAEGLRRQIDANLDGWDVSPEAIADPMLKSFRPFADDVGHARAVLLVLDSLADQIVTAVGTAHMNGMDIVGALHEVNGSNFSKFDDEGNPIFNDNKKIMKGPNYYKPDLVKFLPKPVQG